MPANPTAAILLIGDEILSGRTQDTNGNYLAKQLTEQGIDLCEIRVVSDDAPEIIAAVNALRGRYDHVFTSGGIGPTHDDITADAIAAAFGVGIDVREDARAMLASHYDDPDKKLNKMRLRMARIPDGAELIANPVSKAPGFRLENVYVMAGVPVVFVAMVEAILPGLAGGAPKQSVTVRYDHPEGDIAAALAELAARFPDVSVGSYPFDGPRGYGTNLVARSSDPARLIQIEAALKQLCEK